MIECIFTLDYEIYGDGRGALLDLVYEPAERLRAIFSQRGIRFVNFVEVAEFQRIEESRSDPAIDLVTRQIRELHADGFEIGLHLHPQWCNARYDNGQWLLDSDEYNLCTLPRQRIVDIVDRSLSYLSSLVCEPRFVPLSFRAGNWLFQPTQPAARVLAERGLRIDSSVFRGGLLHNHALDYRHSPGNVPYWKFDSDVCDPDPAGAMIEVPIHVRMVPFWQMATTKRRAFSKRKALKSPAVSSSQTFRQRVNRARDLLRFYYPLKLDFCRMTLDELTFAMGRLIEEDKADPAACRPVVTIGHTKDLFDFDTVERFLAYLESNAVRVSTFVDVYPRLAGAVSEHNG